MGGSRGQIWPPSAPPQVYMESSQPGSWVGVPLTAGELELTPSCSVRGAMTARRGWALIQISKPSDALSSVLSYYLGWGWVGLAGALSLAQKNGKPLEGPLGMLGKQ